MGKRKFLKDFFYFFSASAWLKLVNFLQEILIVISLSAIILKSYYISRLFTSPMLLLLGGNFFFVLASKNSFYKKSILNLVIFLYGILLIGIIFLWYFNREFLYLLLLGQLIIALLETLILLGKSSILSSRDTSEFFYIDFIVGMGRLGAAVILFFQKNVFTFLGLEGLILFFVAIYLIAKKSIPFRLSIILLKEGVKIVFQYKDYLFSFLLSFLAQFYIVYLLKKFPSSWTVLYFWGNKVLEWGNFIFKDIGRAYFVSLLEKGFYAMDDKLSKSMQIVLLLSLGVFIAGVVGAKVMGDYKILFLALAYLPAIPGRYLYQIFSKVFFILEEEIFLFRVSLMQEIVVFLSLFWIFTILNSRNYYLLVFVPSLFSFIVVVVIGIKIFSLKDIRIQNGMFEGTYRR